MSLAISSRSGVRRIPFSELQICGCCLRNGDEPLQTCAKCSVRVHARCYEPDNEVNPSTWLCVPCESLNPSERDTISCGICHMPGGALKPTEEDGWAHVCCALWTPETYFANGDIIYGVEDIPTMRRSLRCIFCKKPGGCVQCSMGKCLTSFHLICACQHGLQLSIEQKAGNPVPTSICHRHKQLTRKSRNVNAPCVNNIREEDAICDVCGHDSASENNDIVICDGCEVAVHQICYGIQSIPENQWFCHACSSDRPGKCILCADGDGAVKMTAGGDWVHISCALWSHQAVFMKPSTLDHVTGLDRLLLDDPDRQCQVCNDAVGFCSDCAVSGCGTFYHVRCARKDKRRVEIYRLRDPLKPLSTMPRLESETAQSELAFVLYCSAHSTVPFSAEDYQRQHPFPHLENGIQSDHETIHMPDDVVITSSKKRNHVIANKTTASDTAVDDVKRSQADMFWHDEVQPYFRPPLHSALHLAKDTDRASDFSFILPPVGKIRSSSGRPLIPSYKSCDWICDQLLIPCDNARRLYALLVFKDGTAFTNLQYDGTIVNFCLVETSMVEGDLFQELSLCQKNLASQIRELDGFRKRIRAKIDPTPLEVAPIHRDVVELHKSYVEMSHSQIVRFSLVAGFRDLDLAASDFTQEHFNTTCRVCFGTEGTEVNPIVICESCGLAVHKYCYGIDVIPEGDWLCNSCSGICVAPDDYECALCPLNGFAFKPSDAELQTVHLVCALWCPQVRIVDMVKMAPIRNVAMALAGDRHQCDICHEYRGITVPCAGPVCSRRFHVTCAWEFGFFMEVKSVEGKPRFNCFCVQHTPEKFGGPQRDRLKQREVRLKARTHKPTPPASIPEFPTSDQGVPASASALPRVLDGEDTYLPDVCAVCFSPSSDALVKCVSCAIVVHRECYDSDASVTEFRCIRCLAQPQRARKTSCVYCPRLGGAYERHETSRWRHKACERWASVFRNNGNRLFPHVVCAICDRREGSCIPCTAQGCSVKFHALCGLFVGCELRSDGDLFMALCPLHTPIHGESPPVKDAVPDLFVFYDRLRLVRADMDELRTIMDLVKRREKTKKRVSVLNCEIDAEVSAIQEIQNRVMDDERREAERLEDDHKCLVEGLQRIMEHQELADSGLEDGEIQKESAPSVVLDDRMHIDSEPVQISPNRTSMDVLHDELVELAIVDRPALGPRRLDFGLPEQLNDIVEESCKDIEHLQLTEGIRHPDDLALTAAKDANNEPEHVSERATPDNQAEAIEGAHGGDVVERRTGLGNSGDHGDDQGSDDDDDEKRRRKDAQEDRSLRGPKAKTSTDEEKDEESDDSGTRPLVSVQQKRINRWATRFRIKINRTQLPVSTNVKIKKALLKNSVLEVDTQPPSTRRRRRSRQPEPVPSSDEEESVASDQGEPAAEPIGRLRRRRVLRLQPESETEDFVSDYRTPLRRSSSLTAVLADSQAKDSDAGEYHRTRWFSDELDYLREIMADTDTDPDWDVVVSMLEDKFGTAFRVYSKNAVMNRWMRMSGVYSRNQFPAPHSSEPHSQRTRWPAEELEYLRSIVANANEEGKKNWPDIVKQMKKKFGHQYRAYTPQILQSKVHRLMNPPEPAEPKEHARKPVVKPSSKLKWANEELEYLRGLVTKLGTEDWVEIANLMDKFLGERHRTYTGPILQKKWRELGSRGQTGPAQEIRDDMIANPVQMQPAASAAQVEAVGSDADLHEEVTSENDLEESLSEKELETAFASDAEEEAVPLPKSPIVEEPMESESPHEPTQLESAITQSQELPASPIAEPGVVAEFSTEPVEDEIAQIPLQEVMEVQQNETVFEEKDVVLPGPEKIVMDVDVAVRSSVELRSPLTQAAPPVSTPVSDNLDQFATQSEYVAPSSIMPTEEPFVEVPWHLEPEDNDELLRGSIQQPPLLFAQSTGDSLFPSPIPAFVMAQGERRSGKNHVRQKANAWRDEEINYLNELGCNPNLCKDWDLIAQMMSEKFGTTFRNKYLSTSIKQRWHKTNPRTPRPVVAGKEPRRPPASKEPRTQQFVQEEAEDQASVKEEQEGVTRTPYNTEELEYLTALVEQFGPRDWSRVAHYMQLRFKEKYRRYAPMSISMKWARLRAKNQVLQPLELAEQSPSEGIPMRGVQGPAVESFIQHPVVEPVIEEPAPGRMTEGSPVKSSMTESGSELLSTPAERVAEELGLQETDTTVEESQLEPKTGEEETISQAPVAARGRKGKTPYANEERIVFHSLYREHGKNFKKISEQMQATFGNKYRQYTQPALLSRWHKVEQFDQRKFTSPAIQAPIVTSEPAVEMIAEKFEPPLAEESVISVDEQPPEPSNQAISAEEIPPSPEIAHETEGLETDVEETAEIPDEGAEILEADLEETAEIPDEEGFGDRSLKVDVSEEAKGPRRSRRSLHEIQPELILSSRTRTGHSKATESVPAAEEAAMAATKSPARRGRVSLPEIDKTPRRSLRTPGRKATKGGDETETDEEAVDNVNSVPPSRARGRGRAAWMEDELDYLRTTAKNCKWEWNQIAYLMSDRFGTERRPGGYTAVSVMTIYRRRFPQDGPTPGLRLRKSIQTPKKRPRPEEASEEVASPRQSPPHAASPSPQELQPQPSRASSPKPTEKVGSPARISADVTSPAQRSPSRSEPSLNRRSIGNGAPEVIEPIAAAVESEPEIGTPVTRRRRRSESFPTATPKRRKTTVPVTEPRKPTKAKIPNQGVNRLDRLIENILEHDFPADQRNKALKFLRAHQAKWRQHLLLAPGDRAFVLDSWQFKPYEIKIVQVYDNGSRYRIHYLSWSSKFDEDLSGEFVFRDGPEIRQIRTMADTYSKTR